MKIGWIQISSKKYGGAIYEQQTRDILAKYFDLDLVNVEVKHFGRLRYLRYLNAPKLFLNLIRLTGEKDLWIRDFFSTVTLSLDKTKGKNMAVVFHIDFSSFPWIQRFIFFLLEKIFYRNLNKVEAILTISEYWENHFVKRGYQQVYKIYNGFNLADFKIDEQEIEEFKRRFNLEGKPIIYLGNCQRVKGVVEACQALRNLDAYLVTSGRPQVKIPAINLNLPYRDYLRLLKASSVVLTMSKFKEGWCRTAHEAMLCKTPVIGSGLGGMRELLEGGKQIICEDFGSLREKAEYLLNHPEVGRKMAEDGCNFAKDFTLERFEKEWIDLVKKLA